MKSKQGCPHFCGVTHPEQAIWPYLIQLRLICGREGRLGKTLYLVWAAQWKKEGKVVCAPQCLFGQGLSHFSSLQLACSSMPRASTAAPTDPADLQAWLGGTMPDLSYHVTLWLSTFISPLCPCSILGCFSGAMRESGHGARAQLALGPRNSPEVGGAVWGYSCLSFLNPYVPWALLCPHLFFLLESLFLFSAGGRTQTHVGKSCGLVLPPACNVYVFLSCNSLSNWYVVGEEGNLLNISFIRNFPFQLSFLVAENAD